MEEKSLSCQIDLKNEDHTIFNNEGIRYYATAFSFLGVLLAKSMFKKSLSDIEKIDLDIKYDGNNNENIDFKKAVTTVFYYEIYENENHYVLTKHSNLLDENGGFVKKNDILKIYIASKHDNNDDDEYAISFDDVYPFFYDSYYKNESVDAILDLVKKADIFTELNLTSE